MTIDPSSAIATADAAVKLFDSVTARIGRIFKGPARASMVATLASLKGYSEYLVETNERVSMFKTFADPSQPVSLFDHFVTMALENGRGRRKMSQDDLITRAVRGARIVVAATAGYGKSMLMRYISLCLFENPQGRIPIFVELRHLNRLQNPDIIQYIHSSYKQESDVQLTVFQNGLENGLFCIVLDGFDELNHEIRQGVEDQILNISKIYPKTSIIVSGRPDDRFYSWQKFSIFKIEPMSRSQVNELITKLDFDEGTKKRFLTKVNKGLYDTHQSFLSAPLMAILMLLTFQENANIPDKMHLFYAKAFETLFHKHDATKEQYERKRKSGLLIDDFTKIFAVFCLNTYVLEKIEFTEQELRSYLEDAVTYTGIKVRVSDFLFDLEEAVCLIHKEGLSFFFIHRSFQEYFTAVFLATCQEDIRDDFLDRGYNRVWDNVLPMLFDMAANQIEPVWVKRNLEGYLEDVGFEKSKILPIEARFSALILRPDGNDLMLMQISPGDWSKFLTVMYRFYSSRLADLFGLKYETLMLDAKLHPGYNLVISKSQNTPDRSKDQDYALSINKDQFPQVEQSEMSLQANKLHLKLIEIYQEIVSREDERADFLKKLFGSKKPMNPN